MNQIQQSEKQKRRTKNDPNNRDFQCGCGKSYLSYPALYTHEKQKHDGQQIQGTSKPILNEKCHRGRPKKKTENKKNDNDNLSNYSSNKNQKSINCCQFDEFYLFLYEIEENMNQEESVSLTNIGKTKLISGIKADDLNYSEIFPKNLFENENIFEEESKVVFDIIELIEYKYKSNYTLKKAIEEIKQEDARKDQENNENQINKNIYYILTSFLCEVGKSLTSDSFKEMCFFTLSIAKRLNQIGYQLDANDQINQELNTCFCSTQKSNVIPLMANEFITKSFEEYYNLLKESFKNNFIIFPAKNQVFRLKNSAMTFSYFIKWLLNNNYTEYSIKIKQNEELFESNEIKQNQ